MDEHFVSTDKNKSKSTPPTSSSSSTSLQTTNRRDSNTSSCRTVSPLAIFHESYITHRTDVQKNLMELQRRAQAIATAPRRKRHDDDDTEEDEAKKSLLGYIKTSALAIPASSETTHPHSLPQLQSNNHLLPTFRIDPPAHDDRGQFDYSLNRSPSAPLPTRKIDCND